MNFWSINLISFYLIFNPSSLFSFLGGSINLFEIYIDFVLVLRITLVLIIRSFRKSLKKYIIISITVILFFIYPTITSLTFKLFQCYNFDYGVKRLMLDTRIQCWGSTHLIFVLSVGLPMLLIWVIGVPLFTLFHLTFHWKHLASPNFQEKYLVFYTGLRIWRYYWETFNTLRKICILTLNIAVPSGYETLKVLSAAVLLYMMLWLEERLKPYTRKCLNKLEEIEMCTSIVTLFSASIFV